jgi:hypothetical protein
VQQQSLRVDQDMSLFPLYLPARIVAVRIDIGPPFSALLTLWLSMTSHLSQDITIEYLLNPGFSCFCRTVLR